MHIDLFIAVLVMKESLFDAYIDLFIVVLVMKEKRKVLLTYISFFNYHLIK